MFYLNTAIRNIKRHKYKSILSILICALIILLLNLYLGNIESNKKQLKSLPDAIPVYCRITNLNGSQEIGLNIENKLIENLKSSLHVKNLVSTVRLMGGIGEFSIEDWKENLNLSILGTNSINVIKDLEDDITLKDEINFDFLETSTYQCIVSQELMNKNQWEIDDSISLNLFYYHRVRDREVYLYPLELLSFKIAGTINEYVSVNTEESRIDIIIPFDTAKNSYARKDINFLADSASFYVKDPLQLNDFKKEMREFGLLSKIPSAKNTFEGNALSVRDAAFITAASRLQQGIQILSSFYPFVFMLIIFIAYIASYLLMHNRKREFFIMRSLGCSQIKSSVIFLTEQILLILIGATIGIILSICLVFINIKTIIIISINFLICYLLGISIALWRFSRTSIMESLFQAD